MMIKGIKWTGSKRWLVPLIKPCDVMVELFAGSAIMSLNRSQKCVLNDTNIALINFYKAMKNDVDKLIFDIRLLDKQIKSAEYPKDAFYAVRKKFNDSGMIDPIAFYVLLMNGFNGLWRCGPNGLNVAYGGKRTLQFEQLLLIPIDNIIALTSDSYETVNVPDVDCVVFADPPYTGSATTYGIKKWTYIDDEALLKHLSSFLNPVIISMLYNEQNITLAKRYGFEYRNFDVSHTAGQGGRKMGQEMLLFNDRGSTFVCE